MMKATFENIGPITKAELELGDFTIIAGQNNTGKTYLAYTLYGFLRFLKNQEFSFLMTIATRGREYHAALGKIANQLRENGKASIGIEEYKGLYNWLMQNASSMFSSGFMNKVFNSPRDEFKDARFHFETEGNYTMGRTMSYTFSSGNKKAFLTPSFANDKLVFRLNNPEKISLPNEEVIIALLPALYEAMYASFPKPFILSAERFSIPLFYIELDFTKNRLVEELQNAPKGFDSSEFIEEKSARYAQPIKDNIDFTRDLSTTQKIKKEPITDKFHSVDNMMNGYYKATNDGIRFISKQRGDNRFDIPLRLASSSARGLSNLYFYLKHVAEPGQLLIVDEPESHLSPTNQVMMARLLVFCVNAGVKVLITTHSDYLIKEINNLIMLDGDFKGKDEFLSKHKKDYTEADGLNPGKVKAYTCANGTLQPCDVDEKGIDMPVFDDAIDKINQISNELGWKMMPDDREDD